MAAGSVQWPGLIQNHLLDQVFATSEEDIAYPPMVLNYAS